MYNINRFVLQESGRLCRVSDCEELVGGYSQEMRGLVFRGLVFYPLSIHQLSKDVSVIIIFCSVPLFPILPFTFVFKEYMIFFPVVKESFK